MPRVPAVGSLPSSLPVGVVYVCVCFGLSLRVHSGPAGHAVRPNPRAGGCNRRSRGLPAVTLPILCTLAPIYVLRFERRFGLSKVLRQSCSPDSCTSPAITFRISVFAHFVYTCRMPFLFIISMSWVSRWVCGKCTQNGQSVAGRGVRPECRDHGPGARIPCPKDRLRRRLSPRASVTVGYLPAHTIRGRNRRPSTCRDRDVGWT